MGFRLELLNGRSKGSERIAEHHGIDRRTATTSGEGSWYRGACGRRSAIVLEDMRKRSFCEVGRRGGAATDPRAIYFNYWVRFGPNFPNLGRLLHRIHGIVKRLNERL